MMFKFQDIKNYLIGGAHKKQSSKERASSFYTLLHTGQIPNLAIVYGQYFGRRTDVLFIECGVYDGECVSNIIGLVNIGWRGYYIEPAPEFFLRCKEHHANNKNITVSHYATGSESRKIEINCGAPLSTISDDTKENFESLDWGQDMFTQEKIMVNQITLEKYLEEREVKRVFELLVIDVECPEWNSLRNFNIQKWKPQMVIIELHGQNDDYPLIRENCNKIVRYFDENVYKIIFKGFTNTIYVKKDSYPMSLCKSQLVCGNLLHNTSNRFNL